MIALRTHLRKHFPLYSRATLLLAGSLLLHRSCRNQVVHEPVLPIREGIHSAQVNLPSGQSIDVIVVHNDTQIHCFYGRCSYGNCMLSYSQSKVYCAKHGTVYSLNGEIQEGPTLYSLQNIPVREQIDGLHLEIPQDYQKFELRMHVPYSSLDYSCYLIVGGQWGFTQFVKMMREAAYKGKMYLIDKHDELYFDDEYTRLRQLFGVNPTGIETDSQAMAHKMDIQVLQDHQVHTINLAYNNFELENRARPIRYKGIIINTGMTAGISTGQVLGTSCFQNYREIKEWIDREQPSSMTIRGVNRDSIQMADILVKYKNIKIHLEDSRARKDNTTPMLDELEGIMAKQNIHCYYGGDRAPGSGLTIDLQERKCGTRVEGIKMEQNSIMTDVYQKVDGLDNVFCLGRQCRSSYWHYPIMMTHDSPSQALEQAAIIQQNRTLCQRVYTPFPLDSIEVGGQVLTQVGLVGGQQEKVETKNGSVVIYSREGHVVGAATLDDHEAVFRLREVARTGAPLDQAQVQQCLGTE